MLPIKIDHVKVPPIKCQGIKTKLIDFISQNICWSGEGKWIEPFLGSGVVLFNIQPQRAIIADSNPHIIKFYQDIQSGKITPTIARDFLKEQHVFLSKTDDTKDSYYYEVRRRFNENPNSLDFLFLSRACFNGMMRFNKSGGFNVPFCRKPDRFRQGYITKITNQIAWIQEIMVGKDWTFVHQDWRKTISEVKKDDFLYLDPPYIGRYADYFNQWSEEEASDLANNINEIGCGYALSMWASSQHRVNNHLKEWDGEVITQSHFYHLGATENLRNSIEEALCIKPGFIHRGDKDEIPVRYEQGENKKIIKPKDDKDKISIRYEQKESTKIIKFTEEDNNKNDVIIIKFT